VAITPAAGVVQPYGAMVLGALSAMACYWALNAKLKFGYDDSLDCFGIHGVGSGLGVVLLSFFIRDSWMEAAAGNIAGWNMWQQLLVQLKGLGATIVFAALVTLIICVFLEKTVGFRAEEQIELEGLDQALHGENGYGLIFPEAR
jgi:Amt family ammonium transporter